MAEEKKIKVRYKEEGVPVLPTCGAYGGLTPDGAMVVASFYIEHGDIPRFVEVNVRQSGISEEPSVVLADSVREIVCKLAMSPEAAIMIGNWLKEKGEQAIKLRKQRGG